MRWKIERTREFEEWWSALSPAERRQLISSIGILEGTGPGTGRPFVDSVNGSRYSNMKELRGSETLRVFFAFDPRRVAILLIGGDKAGRTKRFYRKMIATADKIYAAHLRSIEKGATRNGR